MVVEMHQHKHWLIEAEKSLHPKKNWISTWRESAWTEKHSSAAFGGNFSFFHSESAAVTSQSRSSTTLLTVFSKMTYTGSIFTPHGMNGCCDYSSPLA